MDAERRGTGAGAVSASHDQEDAPQSLPAAAPPGAVPGAGLYKVALVLFFATFLVDTGGSEAVRFGIPLPHAAGALVIATGLLCWRAPRARVALLALSAIAAYVLARVMLGDGLMGGFRVLSLVLLCVIVGGAAVSERTARFHVLAAFAVLSLLVLAYHVGLWRDEWSGRLSFRGFNPNQIALLVVAGMVLGIGAASLLRGRRRLVAMAIVVVAVPVVMAAGSRKAMLLMLLLPLIQLGIIHGRRLLAVGALAGIALMLAPGILQPVLESLARDQVLLERLASFRLGILERAVMVNRGIGLVMADPWTGYGLEAPFTGQWLADNLGLYSIDRRALMVHNGFIDLLLIGGIPYFTLYMLFFGWLLVRLWRARRSADASLPLVATAFVLMLWFVATVFFGDTNTKPGWWMAGFALLVLELRRQETARAGTPSVPQTEAAT